MDRRHETEQLHWHVVRTTALKVAIAVAVAAILGPWPWGLERANAEVPYEGDRSVVASSQAAVLHTVGQGETLWNIAVDHFPQVDPRCGVETIKEANQLMSASIEVGAVLVVPERATCRRG